MKGTPARFLKDSRDVIVALRLLVLAGLAMLGLGQPPRFQTAFWSTTIVYGLTNLGYMASGAARFATARVQRAVFLFDVVVVSALIVMRGSQVPEFIVAYFTLVLMAAVVQGLGSAPINALLVCTVYGAVSLWGSEPRSLLSFPILAQFAFFFVVSVFMSHLAESVREQTRERVRAEEDRRRLETAVADRTQDLTKSLAELETTRNRLAASDRLATIGMLAAGVAHDIRNPIAALRAALEEAPELVDEMEGAVGGGVPGGPGELLRGAVDDARAACDHLQRIASDLTAVARTTPATPVAVPCREALEGASRLLRHRAKPPLSIAVKCTTLGAAMADPGRLQQVLLNLGGNGLDAMEGTSGTLTLSAEDGEPGHVRFVVEDTGVGMSASVAGKAFKAFFTTKAAGKGTGLGLHLVQEIVAAHGARIHVESVPSEGTKFFIEWPAAGAPGPNGGSGHVGSQDVHAADRGRRGEHSPGARADAAA